MISMFNTGYDLQDQIDAAESAIAIVSIGSTHAAITSGQYVYVREHGTLAEGLYRATANVAVDGTLSGSNVTAVSGGGLNALNSKFTGLGANEANAITSTSIDTYKTPGVYAGTIAASITGGNGEHGTLIVSGTSSNLTQTIICPSKTITRVYSNNAFGAWSELVPKSDVVPKDNLIVQSMKKITESSAGTIKFTFTGNRYTALLFKTDNTGANSGIYAISFKQSAQANVERLSGSTTLPTVDADGSISIVVSNWSRVTLMTDAIADFS